MLGVSTPNILMMHSRLHSAKDSPAATAWALLRDLDIQEFPIEPRHIASALGIVLWEREFAGNYDGCLMRVGDAWGILINAQIQSEARRNFTIAHEIGHYQLERDTETRSCSLDERLNAVTTEQDEDTEETSAQRQAYLLSERRANQFAVELLMPTPIFLADAAGLTEVGLPAITALAEQYGTSLTSTGIHYTRLSDLVCAIVFSEAGIIRHFAYSDAFRENRSCYITIGQTLHPESLAYRLTNETHKEPLLGRVPLSCWCRPSQHRRHRSRHSPKGPITTNTTEEIVEHSLRIPSTNRVITFIHFPIEGVMPSHSLK